VGQTKAPVTEEGPDSKTLVGKVGVQALHLGRSPPVKSLAHQCEGECGEGAMRNLSPAKDAHWPDNEENPAWCRDGWRSPCNNGAVSPCSEEVEIRTGTFCTSSPCLLERKRFRHEQRQKEEQHTQTNQIRGLRVWEQELVPTLTQVLPELETNSSKASLSCSLNPSWKPVQVWHFSCCLIQ
jgi:hypothetical protein